MAMRILEITMMNEEDGIVEFSDGIQLKFGCIPEVNLLITSPVSYGYGKIRKYKKRVEALRRHLSLAGVLS